MYADLGLLLLRLAIGGVVLAHGLQKFGQLGGPGLQGIAGFFGSVGFRPPRPWAVLVAVVETVGSVLLILGLLTPVVGLLIAADLLVAIVVVHWPRFWAQDSGLEFPLPIAAGALALALVGPGAWSVDEAIGFRLTDQLFLGLVVVVALVALVAIFSRTKGAAG
jgi:putative oxidoreductase